MKVALIPSNQETNPVLGGSNEMVQVASFIEVLLAQAPAGIECKIFVPPSDKLDTYEFEGLYKVQALAAAWGPDLAINVHTDSGYYTHVGGYYDGSIPSKALCNKIIDFLHPIFGGTETVVNYSTYIFAEKMPAVSLLLELGTHQLQHDIDILKSKAVEIAQAIWRGVTMLFMDTKVVLEHLDMLWGYSNDLMKAADAQIVAIKVISERANEAKRIASIYQERIAALKRDLGLS